MPKFADGDSFGGKPFRKESESMDTIFEALQQTAQRLNTTADAANELIRSTNERLAAIGAGVSYASDNLRLGESTESRWDDAIEREVTIGFDVSLLAYAKINGAWQMGVESQTFVPVVRDSGDEYDLIRTSHSPLLNLDREKRIRVAAMLPQFLREYTQYLNDLADKLDHK